MLNNPNTQMFENFMWQVGTMKIRNYLQLNNNENSMYYSSGHNCLAENKFQP